MNDGLTVVIGMTLMYLFSLAGLVFAWIHYRRRHKPPAGEQAPRDDSGGLS